MKFKVRGEKEEKVVEFWLEEKADRIVLKAGPVGDPGWNLLSVSKDGVRRHECVGDDLGIDLNAAGQIRDLS